jgi:hypothetical protein
LGSFRNFHIFGHFSILHSGFCLQISPVRLGLRIRLVRLEAGGRIVDSRQSTPRPTPRASRHGLFSVKTGFAGYVKEQPEPRKPESVFATANVAKYVNIVNNKVGFVNYRACDQNTPVFDCAPGWCLPTPNRPAPFNF